MPQTATKRVRIRREKTPERTDRFVSREAKNNRVSMTRKVANKPGTLDTASRTVRATIATDTPVRIYDWGSDEYVDEVLLPSGMEESAEGVQLRDFHQSWSNRAVLGSVGSFAKSATTLEATLEFSSASDVEPIFTRVAEGHIRGVSVAGVYNVNDYVQIPARKSQTVDGRKFTAGSVPLRVVTRWTLEEVSIVVRGADPKALTRSRKEDSDRHGNKTKRSQIRTGEKKSPRLEKDQPASDHCGHKENSQMKWTRRSLSFLRKLGLDEKATESQILTFARGLKPDQRSRLVEIQPATADLFESDDADDEEDGDDETEVTRERKPKKKPATKVTRQQTDDDTLDDDSADDGDDQEIIRQAERRRIAAIQRAAAEDIPSQLVQRAIDEGWTIDQARSRFYQHIQRNARPALDNGDRRERAPAGRVANGPTVESLQAAVLMRHGLNLENPHFATEAARTVFERNGLEWLYQFNRDLEAGGRSERERIIDVGRQFSHDHAMRTCERILSLRGRGPVPTQQDAIIERSFGTSYLPRVFGAVISVGLVAGYMAYEDSTRGWVSEADWNDFRDNQPIGIDAASSLKLHTRGTTAKDVEFSDYGEKYKVQRFCGKFILDDQDIIDDIVGANQQMPSQMGMLAASLRPDLVYAVIMTNGNLTDGTALFASGRGNLKTTNALSIDGLTAAEAAMAVQVMTDKSGKTKPMNLRAGWVIVPRTLRASAKTITKSATVVSGSTTPIASNNPHDGEYFMRSDARLDTGVIDPRTDTMVTGSTGKWYLGEASGQHSLQVGYRRGTGRAPQVRTMRLNQPGQFGVGWDVVHDIGVGVVSPKGMVRNDP